MSFNERYQAGLESEQLVQTELEQRGWIVHKWGRNSFPDAINSALNVWHDTYSRPCRLRFLPEFLIVRPNDPQSLRAVEVKRYTSVPQVSRFALNAYLRLESEFWTPVQMVFHDPDSSDNRILGVMPVGEVLMSGRNQWGSKNGSGEPYFHIDPDKLHPFDSFFGKKS